MDTLKVSINHWSTIFQLFRKGTFSYNYGIVLAAVCVDLKNKILTVLSEINQIVIFLALLDNQILVV